MSEARRRWQLERWISWIRVVAVPWAVLEVGVISQAFPSSNYEIAAWSTTGVLALGAAAFFLLDRRVRSQRLQRAVCLSALAFDTLVIWAYVLIYTFEPGTPIRQLLIVPVVEAALRYGVIGGVVLPLLQAPVLLGPEWWRAHHLPPPHLPPRPLTF